MDTRTFLQNALAGAVSYLTETRRFLHGIPELGFELYKTAAFVESELISWGYDPQTGIAKTGIIADLQFGRPGPCLMIRADMDGLPIEEATGLPYASEHPGCMHACGHDGHTAMVLGAAKIMSALAASPLGQELAGSIRFLFQPAEEAPGGAIPMIKEGAMQGVDCCLAAHIWPQLALGKVGIKSGPLMAATDRFKIFLKGRGGHSSQPHLCDDVLGAVAELALILPREAGGRMNPALPGVLSVCCIQAGHTFNVMPETAQLWGCCRGFHPEVYLAWKKAIEGICAGTAAAYGLEYELVYMPGHGAVNNDPAISNAVGRAAVMAVGAENVVEPQLSMAGEDFACFQEEAPGCLFFLGCGQDGTKGLHSPEFIFDESVLATGCNIFCRAALEILRAD